VDRLRLHVPGTLPIRLSVLAGNVRMRAIVDRVLRPGDAAVDVGANIGAIAAYAARRVGPSGHLFAVEPAPDNLAILRENLARNDLRNVTIVQSAAGRCRETRSFYQRGDVSAVNSLFPESCYGTVTSVSSVDVVPLDDIVDRKVALVKIDVEGAEIDVLAGMPRLLAQDQLTLVVEWHPALQQAAGYQPDRLPRLLLESGFELTAVSHLGARRLTAAAVEPMTAKLLARRSPVELLCARPGARGARG
jgi:FkbM family methyltransferase